MLKILTAFVLGALVLSAPALAGAPSPCGGTVGTGSALVVFPASGHGPSKPTQYVTISNPGTNTLYVNGHGSTATSSDMPLLTGGYITWAFPAYPPPAVISIIASGSSSPYACEYQ
jgi:hypothetical protein